ncbi:MAG: FkbM family methyltransferase [Chitinophagales bacterium]|nr:FkbM family methyltransferase [Chitinophagales bacterium]MDW8418781.1 FkbM family methyltransferase [Chitinophagales bacterium]
MILPIIEAYRKGEIDKPVYINKMYEQHARLFEYVSRIRHTELSSVCIQDDGLLFTTREHHIKIFCDKNDKRAAPFEILNFETYESHDALMLYRLINDGDLIFDIGANIGWYSMHFARKFPRSAVHSFEPVADTYKDLCRNVQLNQFQNITTYPFGFSDEEKTVTFYVSRDTSVSSSARDLVGDESVREISCHLVKLDDFTKEHRLQPAFIKCDVEGAELFVFKGALQTIFACRPVVFTEMLRKWSAKYNYHPNDIIRLFADMNYACYTATRDLKLKSVPTVDELTTETNFIFLHSEKHRDIIRHYVS